MDHLLGLTIDSDPFVVGNESDLDNLELSNGDKFEDEDKEDNFSLKDKDIEMLPKKTNQTKSRGNSKIEYDDDNGEDDEDEEQNSQQDKVIYGHYKTPKYRFMLNRRDLILGTARNLFAGYNWNSLVQLSATLISDTRINGFTLFKYVMLALYSHDPDQIDPDDLKRFVINFADILEERFEFMLEIIIFILNNENRFLGHRSFLSDLKLLILKRRRRTKLPKCRDIIFKIYRLYEEYLDFLEWKQMSGSSYSFYYRPSSYHSNIDSSVLSNKIKTNLDQLLNEPEIYPEMNLDIGVLMLLELFDNDNELPQALQMLESYAEKNPNHMNGHIYLYEFLNHFPDIGENRMKIVALKSIVRLCPDSKYTLRLASELPELTKLSRLDRIEMIGDYLDYNHNRNSRKAWKLLNKTLDEFNKNHCNNGGVEDLDKLRLYFGCRLKFWKRIHFDIVRLRPLLPGLKRFHQSRSYDSDYSSDISTASEGSYNGFNRRLHQLRTQQQQQPTEQEFSLNDYHLQIYKGKVLSQLELFMELPNGMVQYKELIMSL